MYPIKYGVCTVTVCLEKLMFQYYQRDVSSDTCIFICIKKLLRIEMHEAKETYVVDMRLSLAIRLWPPERSLHR